jgi:hypothetical protein
VVDAQQVLVTQSVEYPTFNRDVRGSSPRKRTKRLAVRKTVTICSCGGIGRHDTLKMCFSMGSSPIGSTTSCSTITAIHGLLAQLVEQRTVNPRVAGSSPVQPAICPSGGMAYALV